MDGSMSFTEDVAFIGRSVLCHCITFKYPYVDMEAPFVDNEVYPIFKVMLCQGE